MTTITPPAYVIQSEEALDKKYDPQIARKLVAFLGPYRRQAVIALILNAVATLTNISGPYFVKLALDNGIAKSDLVALRTPMGVDELEVLSVSYA